MMKSVQLLRVIKEWKIIESEKRNLEEEWKEESENMKETTRKSNQKKNKTLEVHVFLRSAYGISDVQL